MPRHFKSKEGYDKWQAFKHIHGLDIGRKETNEKIWIAGKLHKVKHRK